VLEGRRSRSGQQGELVGGNRGVIGGAGGGVIPIVSAVIVEDGAAGDRRGGEAAAEGGRARGVAAGEGEHVVARGGRGRVPVGRQDLGNVARPGQQVGEAVLAGAGGDGGGLAGVVHAVPVLIDEDGPVRQRRFVAVPHAVAAQVVERLAGDGGGMDAAEQQGGSASPAFHGHLVS